MLVPLLINVCLLVSAVRMTPPYKFHIAGLYDLHDQYLNDQAKCTGDVNYKYIVLFEAHHYSMQKVNAELLNGTGIELASIIYRIVSHRVPFELFFCNYVALFSQHY